MIDDSKLFTDAKPEPVAQMSSPVPIRATAKIKVKSRKAKKPKKAVSKGMLNVLSGDDTSQPTK